MTGHLDAISKASPKKDLQQSRPNMKWVGYWHQRADERHDNPPQGNQELLVVRDKVGRSQVSLG